MIVFTSFLNDIAIGYTLLGKALKAREGSMFYCKRLMFLPYPHTENYKQWQIDDIHRELKCYTFDEDLDEYLKLKNEFENEG